MMSLIMLMVMLITIADGDDIHHACPDDVHPQMVKFLHHADCYVYLGLTRFLFHGHIVSDAIFCLCLDCSLTNCLSGLVPH